MDGDGVMQLQGTYTVFVRLTSKLETQLLMLGPAEADNVRRTSPTLVFGGVDDQAHADSSK
jgi:hypothetical protein